AEHDGDEDGKERCVQRIRCTPDEAAQDIAAKIVGAEPVCPAWLQQQLADILLDRRVRRDPRREQRDHREDYQIADPQPGARIGLHPAPQLDWPWRLRGNNDSADSGGGHDAAVLGSSSALKMSTARLTRMTITTSTRMTPCTTGKSLLIAE